MSVIAIWGVLALAAFLLHVGGKIRSFNQKDKYKIDLDNDSVMFESKDE